jgi:hypothetical protein
MTTPVSPNAAIQIKAIYWLRTLKEDLSALSPLDEDYASCRLSRVQAIEELEEIISRSPTWVSTGTTADTVLGFHGSDTLKWEGST